MMTTVTEPGNLIAIDWGITNRRGYLLDADGSVLEVRQDNCGIMNLASATFAVALTDFINDWRDQNATEPSVLMSGMIGSRQGWIEAPYVACPVRRDGLICDVVPAPGLRNCFIVPGVCLSDRAARHDVMRGEEVQIFGAIRLIGQDTAILCLPGTHSKWAQIKDGWLVDFTTAMTGELFQVLREHSILGALMNTQSNHDEAAFRKGVDASGRIGGLLSHIFSVRADGLFGTLTDNAQFSHLSGILIGHEIRDLSEAHKAKNKELLLVGSTHLTAMYGAAMSHLGLAYRTVDGDEAAICGFFDLWSARLKI